MGYTNDVRISTSLEGWNNIKDKLPFTPEIMETYRNGVVFGWDCITWYEGGGDHADEINRLLDTELDDKNHPNEFLRIGEDLDDTELHRSYWREATTPDIPHLHAKLVSDADGTYYIPQVKA